MWVLDGLLAKDMAEKENQFLEEDSIFEEDSTKDIVNQDKDEAPPSHRDNIVNQSELNRANSIMPSSLNRNDTDMIALHILPTISESSEEENPSQFVRKNSRRKISWADSKSGQSLDNHYYQDEVSPFIIRVTTSNNVATTIVGYYPFFLSL
jgi:hypothetical protein